MKLTAALFAFLFLNLFINSYAQQSFPDTWEGNYKGDLMIYGVDSVKMQIEMELKIKKTSNDSISDWTIIYHTKDKNDVRAYSLVLVDKQKGHYKIDEKNSIMLDVYLHNNLILTSFFEVMESTIIITYKKVDNNILFELIASKPEPVSKTGNTKFNDEDIPEVLSFKVNGRQKAILKKVD